MPSIKKISSLLFGPPRDPLNQSVRQHIALVAFMAWVGMGADGLSSANYGPEEAFLALGGHTQLAIFLAIATAVTVFIISLAYMQVIDLFPNGGGGYRVATDLLGPRAGLVSGSALIIDYVLTIAISIASGVDAVFSLLPIEWHGYKVPVAIVLILLLIFLNLRGMKESIKILMPIFLGFVITHVGLILYGISVHYNGIADLIPEAVNETHSWSKEVGFLAVAAVFLKAFSLGGGTYTGLEAVSNNVNTLAEPRVRTGKITMVAVAFSLAFMAAGIIMLYLLWDVQKVEGQTLNASVFSLLTADWAIAGVSITTPVMIIVQLFAAGLLFVAANTGFLAGPNVLANMANDRWMPSFFSALSSRLVTKNGVVLMGVAAIGAILLTHSEVSILVVLYSINVFLTFTLSLVGLSKYWITRRPKGKQWPLKLLISGIGMLVCGSILIVTTVEKFETGGWMTILITSCTIMLGYAIHNHYREVSKKLALADELFAIEETSNCKNIPAIDASKPTAVLLVKDSQSSAMHTLLWIMRLFPGVYRNFIFVSVGEVDSEHFNEEAKFAHRRSDIDNIVRKVTLYCHNKGYGSEYYTDYATDVVDKLTELCMQVMEKYPNAVFFSSKLIFDDENIFTQLLHNRTAYLMQRRLHALGRNMIIMPMKV
jgi:amino acid transporter